MASSSLRPHGQSDCVGVSVVAIIPPSGTVRRVGRAHKGSRFGEPPTIAHVGYILLGAGTASDSHRAGSSLSGLTLRPGGPIDNARTAAAASTCAYAMYPAVVDGSD